MTGYVILYTNGNQSDFVRVGENETSAVITGLIAGETYSIKIVAMSSTLPSNMTMAENVTIG